MSSSTRMAASEHQTKATVGLVSSLSLLLFKFGLQILLRAEEPGLLGGGLRQLDPLLLQLFKLQDQGLA